MNQTAPHKAAATVHILLQARTPLAFSHVHRQHWVLVTGTEEDYNPWNSKQDIPDAADGWVQTHGWMTDQLALSIRRAAQHELSDISGQR